MLLKDLSASGLSFVLSHELPGLEPGRLLEEVTFQVRGQTIRGEIVVMHVTPEPTAGSCCGALFYPATDEDILHLRDLVAELQEESDRQGETAPATVAGSV